MVNIEAKQQNIIITTVLCIIGIIMIGALAEQFIPHSQRYHEAYNDCQKLNQFMHLSQAHLDCACYADCVNELSNGKRFQPVDTETCIHACYDFKLK